MKQVALVTVQRGQLVVYEGQQYLVERKTAVSDGRTALYLEGRADPVEGPDGQTVAVVAPDALQSVWG